MAYNPVAKNNKHKGGPFKNKDKEGKSYISQKIKKELDELDEEWIEDELIDYEHNETE